MSEAEVQEMVEAPKTPGKIPQRRTPKLNNDPALNEHLPSDPAEWKTRDPFFPAYPKDTEADEKTGKRCTRREWLAEVGAPMPTGLFRCCLLSKDSRGPDGKSPRGTPSHPYECYAVDESEAKSFFFATIGFSPLSHGCTITRTDNNG